MLPATRKRKACEASLPGRCPPQIIGGTLEYYRLSSAWPPGPRNIEEISDWPRRTLQLLRRASFGEAQVGRLFDHLARGIVMHTDCSGKLTPEISVKMLGKAFGKSLKEPFMVCYRAADTDATCQRIALESSHRVLHVFASLRERVPQPYKARIMNMHPAKNASDEECAAAWSSIKNYVRTNRWKIFGKDHIAGMGCCLRHPGLCCRTVWADPPGCPATKRPLKISFAGCPCVPWSSFGTTKGLAHEAMETFYLWCEEAAEAGYDVVFAENAPAFAKQDVFTETMNDSGYLVVSLVFGPQEIGYPVRRTRMYAAAVNLDTMVWLGPASQSEVAADFFGIFGCKVEVEADVYAGLDDNAKVLQVRADLARCRGQYIDISRVGLLPVESLLPPGVLHTYRDYKEQFESGARVGLGGSFVADLSQDPQQRNRCGPWMPTTARSSTLMSLSSNHIFTSREIDMTLGIPTLSPAADMYGDCVGFDFNTLSPNQRRLLAGNGMHAAQVGAFFSYIMSRCARRSSLQPIHGGPCPIQKDDGDDDSDLESPEGVAA